MDKDTERLVRRIQKQEDAERAERIERLQRALKTSGRKFLNHEITAIEAACAVAVGRVAMDR